MKTLRQQFEEETGLTPEITTTPYKDWLEKRLSEREQPVKDGFEKWMEKEISLMNPQGKKMLNYIRVLTKYRSLSPCKEKWISVEEKALKYWNPIYNNLLGHINEDDVLKWLIEFGKQIYAPPTGDNKCNKCGSTTNLCSSTCPTDRKRYCKNCVSGDNKKGEGE